MQPSDEILGGGDMSSGQIGPVVGALVGASVAGVAGAALWAAVAYFANLESGWIAWGVGALCGAGALIGGGRSAGFLGGVVAVVLAMASICGGKYAAVHFGLNHADSMIQAEIEEMIAFNHDAPEHFKSFLADRLIEERVAAGRVPNRFSAQNVVSWTSRRC